MTPMTPISNAWSSVRTIISRLLDLLLRRQREDRLSQEIQAHLDLLTEEHVAGGISLADARLAARKSFGGVDQVKVHYREQRGLPIVDAWLQDARFAVRLLARDRGFALTAIVVLAFGIGVNHMFVTMVYAHKFRGLPIDRPDRVLFISTYDDRAPDRLVSLPDLEDIRGEQRTFEGLAAYMGSVVTIGDEGRAPDRFDAAYLSSNALALIGVRPLAGRGPEPQEDRPGAAPVVMLGADAWRTRYGSDPSIVGRSILVNGSPATVVGIIPDRSGFPSVAGIWLPLGQLPGLANLKRDSRNLRVFGRLRDGSTESDARAEIQSIVGRLEAAHPDTNRNLRARVTPINERLLGNLDGWMPFITAAVIVILVASANVANLMMARAMHRAPEMAIRTSLGASRFRLIRQLIIEGMVLAAIGGALGLAFSTAGVRLVQSAIPQNMLPYWLDYSTDAGTLALLVGVSFASVFVFGLIPALQASKIDVNQTLKDGSRSGHRGRATRVWTAAFLVAELALATVLLAQVALGNVTARRTVPTDAALRTTAVMTAAVTLPADNYPTAGERGEFFRRLEERLHAQPAVAATALTTFLPVSSVRPTERSPEVEGRAPGEIAAPGVSVIDIDGGYFNTLGLTLTRGRRFSDRDGSPGQATAIVNERFVEMFLSDADPLGRRIFLVTANAPATTPRLWTTIIGVAPSIRQHAVPEPGPVVYLPIHAATPGAATLMVRTNLEPSGVASLLRDEARAIDPNVPLYRMQTLEAAITDALWNSRVSNYLSLTVTILSLILATVGLYAVTAHGVTLRTREIGVRMALGARSFQVSGLILRSVRIPLALGLLLGVAGALAWDRMFSSGLADVSASEPEAILIIAAIMATVVTLACFIPVRKATRMNPVSALRHE
ncbi:MAG: ADOP family duplicated permease [Acidobacteriota bacterium]|nr:ADOP family duplicated permease [Acidobacteriota bacterium]